MNNNSDIFKNILVTYVKPTNKEAAFKMGLTMAKIHNSKLSVVEFHQENTPQFVFFKTKKDRTKEDNHKHKISDLLKKFEDTASKENISLKTSIKFAESVVDSILQYVESNKIDLLIVAHPHASHSKEQHYNDIVNAIHDEVNCNVLTLKQ